MTSHDPTLTSPDLDGSGGGTARVRHVHVVMAPEELGRSMVPLFGDPLEIGRDEGKPGRLELPDHECSRRHARLERDPARDVWRVIDLGSRNGLWVDGVRTEAAELRPGTVVRVGVSLLVFSEIELLAEQALAPERPGLLGRSLAMQRVRGDLDRVAKRAVNVVVLGETGVGKERVAAELHRASGRSGAFVPVNCAAISDSVAESELFGHVQGAFTGATAKHEGLFVAAHRGTLFLDEIGELPLAQQAKLLRALGEGEVRAIGASEARTVDVRVVAATHADLGRQIAAGSFRGDLWARLAGWQLDLPPLRHRREDVLLLARAFLPAGVKLSPTAAEALLLHDWPFNVRELASVVGAAALRTTDGVIRVTHLPAALTEKLGERGKPGEGMAEPPLEALVERSATPGRAELELVMKRFRGSVALTAEFFGKERRQIYRWLERHGLDPEALRRRDGE